MADASKLYREYYLEYASYVVKERAIPYIEDGFKPVQRRIIHTLLEKDNGMMHKVAEVVGDTMKYHPHGDSSIYEALVNLESFKYFIEGGGSFKNILTGDPASAARYIECRILPFAKKVLYSPNITEYVPSYDSRHEEPVVFPAKLPVVLLQGVSGVAVGMSTRILPHNPHEVISAMKCAIHNKPFELYPDFATGGIMDVSEYDDGRGKVSIRSKIEIKDNKLIIHEIPYGCTTVKLIQNIDKLAKSGRLRIQGITDLTAEEANIEIELENGCDAQKELDNLYAFSNAEMTVNGLNPLVIKDGHPVVMGVSDIIKFHAGYLQQVLTKELDFDRGSLLEKLQMRALERIFIEERIYKKIESLTSQEKINEVVIAGLNKFKDEFVRDLSDDDVKHLLELPIRRISLFDINKNKQEIEEINARIAEVDDNLRNIRRYAVTVLDDLEKSLPKNTERRTQIATFSTVKVKDVIQRNLSLCYDKKTGQLGYEIKGGDEKLKVSPLDKILLVHGDGTYRVVTAPDKLFVGKNVQFIGYAAKEFLNDIVFSVLFREKKTHLVLIKRCKILQYTLNKVYSLLPEGNYECLKLTNYDDAEISIDFISGRGKHLAVYLSDYLVKGVSSKGVQLSKREIESFKITKIDPESRPARVNKEGDEDLFGNKEE